MQRKAKMETNQSSHFLLRLYDSVFSQPLQKFKDRALKLLQRDVPFDTALWAGGLVKGTSVERLHFTHLFELPANFLDTWSPRKEEDGLLKRILSEPGKAFTEADLMDQKPRREDRELYKKHSQRYQIARVMSLARIEPVTGLFCAISLYRKDAQQPFSREEGAFFETGVPHLMQAAV